ncbi:MAG: isocitrate/isopropylmalate dehydrogenase family protein [Ignisphaera sp.]|nr:isocitrate/isopropylmalate dehydrogenase family protein [Ignisphaera sp.]MCX8167443.1 isocitrate/isopropylmalate dehydrogenase family protein [Ignisphaera sp.]MDW8084693.1 isocitrate/isopropylmalate dehydrogenase family protein [Ignisphaera sp.]
MSTPYRIAVIEGDGIGPEITLATLNVLEKLRRRYNLNIDLVKVEVGDRALAKFGSAVPEESWKIIELSDAILKGPVGESAGDVVVKIRRGLDLYANIRPAKVYPGVRALRNNVDLVIVRENTEDVYVRAEYMLPEDVAVALRVISRRACRRISKIAFEIAHKRKKHLTVVHKANVLSLSDGLFRDAVYEMGRTMYPDVTVNEMYVDAAVMDLVRRPELFDVIVTTNLYGDILSDLAAYVTGSIGLAASANIGDNKAMFEPIHGAAFDIAGKGIANPAAMMLSLSWLFKWLGEKRGDHSMLIAGKEVENAVIATLSKGERLTPDLGGSSSTQEFTEAVISKISL